MNNIEKRNEEGLISKENECLKKIDDNIREIAAAYDIRKRINVNDFANNRLPRSTQVFFEEKDDEDLTKRTRKSVDNFQKLIRWQGVIIGVGKDDIGDVYFVAKRVLFNRITKRHSEDILKKYDSFISFYLSTYKLRLLLEYERKKPGYDRRWPQNSSEDKYVYVVQDEEKDDLHYYNVYLFNARK